MKHLIFFYITISALIGPLSLTLLILAYLKTKARLWLYIFLFLLSLTIDLILLSVFAYRYTNVPQWYDPKLPMFIHIFESVAVIMLPLAGNEALGIAKKKRIQILSCIALGIMLSLIISAYASEAIRLGVPFESLPVYKFYVIMFIIPIEYVIAVIVQRLKPVSNQADLKFFQISTLALIVTSLQYLFPVFKTFPQNILVMPAVYFLWNLYLMKYTVEKVFLHVPEQVEAKPLSISVEELKLTEREKEIVLLLMHGKTYKDIGTELFISEDTVKTHIKNIYKKLGVRNRLQLLNLINGNMQ